MGSASSKMAAPAPAAAQQTKSQPVRTNHARAWQPGNQALLRVQRKCSCGDCSKCSADREIQTKLKIGSPGDHFEREADSVAAQMMSAPSAPTPTALGETQLQPSLRPGISAISHAAGPAEAGLIRGGSPLPSSAQSYFGDRLGRDLSHVRVHQGSEAAAANDQLSSYAFAYGNHIWYGQGQSAGVNLLTAHELAHVVQQTTPRGAPAAEPQISRRIRGEMYLEPMNWDGTATHGEVLGQLERVNKGLLHEVWIPNGNTKGVGYGHRGRADLFRADAIPGVFFADRDKPEALPALDRYTQRVAPVVEGKTIRDARHGPQKLEVGDLKPIGERTRAGVDQVQNYVAGVDFARNDVNEMYANGAREGLKHSADGHWPNRPGLPVAKPLTNLRVPDRYGPAHTGQEPRELIVKEARLSQTRDRIATRRMGGPRTNPMNRIMGYLAVEPDRRFPGRGIWNHYWWTPAFPQQSLPRELQRLPYYLRDAVIEPLYRSPLQTQPKKKPGLTPDTQPVIRRKEEGPLKDAFNYTKWRDGALQHAKDQVRGAEAAPGTLAEEKALEMNTGAIETLKEFSSPAFTGALQVGPAIHDYRKLKFWTGRGGTFMGLLRKTFGSAFVNVARFFRWAKGKLDTLLENIKATGDSTPAKVAFKIAQLGMKAILNRVNQRLMDSLRTGLMDKAKDLIPRNIVDTFEEKEAQFKGWLTDLDKLGVMNVVEWVQGLMDKAKEELAFLRKIKDIVDEVREIVSIVRRVRWAAKIIACVETAGIGCVVAPLLDPIIERIIQQCWFQRDVAPLVLDLPLIKDTIPNKIARAVIDFVRGFLPADWKMVLAPLNMSEYKTGNIPCGDAPIDPSEAAIRELADIIQDEDKLAALAELMDAWGPKRGKITIAQIKELAKTITGLNVTAQQMRDWARDTSQPPPGISEDFAGLFMAIASADKPVAGSGGTTSGSSSGSGGSDGSGTEAKGGSGSGSGDGVTEIGENKVRYRLAENHGNQPRSLFKLGFESGAAKRGGLKPSDRLTISVSGYWDGILWKKITGVRVTVLSVSKTGYRFRMDNPSIIIGPGAHLSHGIVLCYRMGHETDTRGCSAPK